MKEELISILATLGYPVFLQGTLQDTASYPESFFTFWNFSTPEAAYYDNDAGRAVWGYWIYFYSTSPLLVETEPEKARKLLKSSGYILEGKAHDIAVDKPTHTGAFITCYVYENYNTEEENTDETGRISRMR